jgi:CubicO group peptidase (beta-lactamase class C family)
MSRAHLVLLAAGLAACSDPEPTPDDDCPSAVAIAEATYLECTDVIGLVVEELEIGPTGDIAVLFAEGSDPELMELARRECEPLMQEALVLGLLACETTEVGRPASAQALQEQVVGAGDEGFSGSVAVVREGAMLWSGGVGEADRERGIPNTPQTAFDCGSIMKIVTATAIFQLESDGVLSRGTTLGELFPDAPPDKAAITLELVLQHRAGFDEFHDDDGDFEPMDRDTALQRILGQELLFTPGDDESYSNSGYTLLAIVVEDASGMAFPEFIRTRTFAPAGMSRSGVYGDGLWPAEAAAIGYDDGTFMCNSPACWPAPSWALMGNGGLVSTVEDLVRFTAAIDDAVVIDPAGRDALRSVVLGDSGFRIDGDVLHGYSGRNDFGFGATVIEVPSRGTTVVVASNAAAVYDNTALAVQLAQMSLGALLELGSTR